MYTEQKRRQLFRAQSLSQVSSSINQSIILGTKPPASKPNTTITLLETHTAAPKGRTGAWPQ